MTRGAARISFPLILSLCLLASPAFGADEAKLPGGYWTEEQARPILDKTLRVRLAPDLSSLTEGEKAALAELLDAGPIVQTLYEASRHPQALDALADLEKLDRQMGSPPATGMLLDLYRLFQGPVATTLDNERVAFLPVSPEGPGRNVYPAGLTREEMDRYLAAHPDQERELMDLRSVVRRGDRASVSRDLAVLDRHPVLDTLHPGLRARLEEMAGAPRGEILYAVPYSVAWAEPILDIYAHLNRAAEAVRADDEDFARYLRDRARDLLADDYDGSDAAWVTGRFEHLNAQIGSYETYDDEMYGVRTFFGMSLLSRDVARSDALRKAVRGLQEIEDLLPYEDHKKIREDIPIGVYDVVADFGQARGSNTATILPNEAHLARRYGRTILLRANIIMNPEIFEIGDAAYRAAVGEAYRADLTPEGQLQRTLWHEIGHYLGVDRTKDGRDLGQALQDAGDLLEEMKSDLVSLFAVQTLKEKGYYDEAAARSVYASGILRVLQKTKPRRAQPYQTMQLMQWNFFLETGLLAFDAASGTLAIDYDRYPDSVRALLERVLAIQSAGDRERAERFVQRYTSWKDDLHGVVAGNMRAAEKYRSVLIRYAALGE